ncbi:MAG: transglycosylase SLT domain-containing protein [Gammaproteobacteria bacterium]
MNAKRIAAVGDRGALRLHWPALGGLALIVLCLPALTRAAEVRIPLTIRFDLLTQQISEQLYTQAGHIARIWRESDCRYLELDHPQFSRKAGRLRFTSHGKGSFGAEVLQTCLSPVDWTGFIEVLAEPYLTADWQLRLRIVDSGLYDEAWKPGLMTGLLWEVTERLFLPRLDTLSVDLAPPVDEIRSLVRASVPATDALGIERILQNARAGDVAVRNGGVVVALTLDVPDVLLQATPLSTQPEPPLSAEEIEAHQQALERWDAFLVFVIKELGGNMVDPQIREQLFDLLLFSRYQFLKILSGEAAPRGDPVRALFLEAWKRLSGIVAEGARRGLLDHKLLRYVTFIDAGEALLALDQAAPGLGIAISADGLRRLARLLRPEAIEDPLRYEPAIDPALRTLFGFPPEIPIDPAPELEPQAYFQWLPEAHAAPMGSDEFAALRKRLDRWVPEIEELPKYREILGQLLARLANAGLEKVSLELSYAPIFRHLMPATALQESCWRHFQRKGKQITYLASAAGSIGLMQINPRVWRGFYDVEQLKWNVVYNGRAGAEILVHYLKNYGLAEGGQTGKLENVARATYAVYNAGPGAVTRYRDRSSTPRERRVDKRFRKLYHGFAHGGEVDLVKCTVHPAS